VIVIRLDNVEEVQREMGAIGSDQLPFAMALSITKTAQAVQSGEREQLPVRFTLRRAAWMKANIKVKAATKSDPQAVVTDTYDAMELQESGGAKYPYGQYICVPIVGGARRSISALIRDEDTPKALMASGDGFIRGNIMYRRGAQYKRAHKYTKWTGPNSSEQATARAKITPMYVLVTRANVPARYDFAASAKQISNRVWPEQFRAAFLQAVKTAR
jgi:hypothetical protein